jgi:hypothetical protein
MVPDPGIIKVPTEIDVFVLALSEVEGLALSDSSRVSLRAL